MSLSRETTPVTVLSGSLGAGKTTLLNQLLDSSELDIAVLVNDMGELNVDAERVSDRSELSVADGSVAELSNGCICCELQDDLETAVVRLADDRSFDQLVVEPSGISEPAPVARLFTGGSPAAARYRVDAVVAVVDSRLFADTFAGGDPDTVVAAGDGETRPMAELLVEQVEFADVVLLNKSDLVTEAELDGVRAVVETLRPDAEVLRTSYAEVDPEQLLGVDLFDPQLAAERAGWQQLLAAANADGDGEGGADGHYHDGSDHTEPTHEHVHPDEAYGIDSFTYRRRRPFHPGRVADLLGTLPEDVLRAKGNLWVAGREDTHLTFSQAGPSAYVEGAGRWIASLPEYEQDGWKRNHRDPGFEWDDQWGDRRVELVFIGQDIDAIEDDLRAKLDDALLTDAEMAQNWGAFENDLPTEPGMRTTLAEPAP